MTFPLAPLRDHSFRGIFTSLCSPCSPLKSLLIGLLVRAVVFECFPRISIFAIFGEFHSNLHSNQRNFRDVTRPHRRTHFILDILRTLLHVESVAVVACWRLNQDLRLLLPSSIRSCELFLSLTISFVLLLSFLENLRFFPPLFSSSSSSV